MILYKCIVLLYTCTGLPTIHGFHDLLVVNLDIMLRHIEIKILNKKLQGYSRRYPFELLHQGFESTKKAEEKLQDKKDNLNTTKKRKPCKEA